MAGLVPAIHVFIYLWRRRGCRHKAGHDRESGWHFFEKKNAGEISRPGVFFFGLQNTPSKIAPRKTKTAQAASVFKLRAVSKACLPFSCSDSKLTANAGSASDRAGVKSNR
jgi:hypothetical protein